MIRPAGFITLTMALRLAGCGCPFAPLLDKSEDNVC
jgi:hypothetical protein